MPSFDLCLCARFKHEHLPSSNSSRINVRAFAQCMSFAYHNVPHILLEKALARIGEIPATFEESDLRERKVYGIVYRAPKNVDFREMSTSN